MKWSVSLLAVLSLAAIGVCVAISARHPVQHSPEMAGSLSADGKILDPRDRTSPHEVQLSSASIASVGKSATPDATGRREVATLAGGCFWCMEAAFSELRGVDKAQSGYAGGTVQNPNYEEVSSGGTGHAETVQITFDPSQISYRDLLEVFFTIHDPTTLNRQGADVGTQYRSVIFYNSAEQKRIAEEVIAEINASKVWEGPIVTQVTPLTKFYPAEAYHDDYYRRHRDEGYCQLVISPKLEKLREAHRNLIKK